MVKENGIREDGSVRENSLLVLKVQENGTISVLCGRATDVANQHRVILPVLILGLVGGALRVAADLATRHAGYEGHWAICLRLTGIKAAVAYDHVESGDVDMVHPYDADLYEKILTTSTADLIRSPEALTGRLVGALLRGLSVESR